MRGLKMRERSREKHYPQRRTLLHRHFDPEVLQTTVVAMMHGTAKACRVRDSDYERGVKDWQSSTLIGGP